MRGMYKIRYAIWLVAGFSLFISGCPFKSGVEGKAWFRYALKFDQARNDLIENDLAGKNSAMRDFARLDKIILKYMRAKQPTEDEIISVLKSPNREFQKVGLTAMFLKPIETDKLIEILFEFLQDQDRQFKGYAFDSLGKFADFPESKKAALGERLLEIVKKEKDDYGLFNAGSSLLAKFPSEEAGRFLTEQLMKEDGRKEDRLLRLVAFNALKEMGESYYEKAKEYVNAHGSSEIKDEVLKNEKAWEDMHSEENEKSINECFPGKK